jgi:methanogenic corrinoid protein MtbC1
MMGNADHAEMSAAVVDGNTERARALARLVLSSGADVLAAIENGFAQGVRRVGELWEEGDYFLPELIQGAEAMKAAMELLRPALGAERSGKAARGRVVIGTVRGDLHDIGKGLVATLLSANGFEVHDLGNDVAVESFVARARETEADIVAASALLTTTMLVQRDLAVAIAEARLPKRPRLLIGGAPTTPEWAAEIGASHAENAHRAVTAAEGLLR